VLGCVILLRLCLGCDHYSLSKGIVERRGAVLRLCFGCDHYSLSEGIVEKEGGLSVRQNTARHNWLQGGVD
jgi:hypothetical protein